MWRGPAAVKSLWRSDFDVRLAGLSSGTGGHQSLTGVVPPFLPLPAQTDPVYLRQVSVKEVPPGCQCGGVPLVLRRQLLNPPIQNVDREGNTN